MKYWMASTAAACAALTLVAAGCGGGGGSVGGGNTNNFDASTLQGDFPFGVWLQDPTHQIGGRTTAELYKEIGISHWMGIYLWPDETIRYPGYNVQAAELLQTYGYKVFAGQDQTAIDWNTDHPQFRDTYVGYLVGDEPDMTKFSNPEHYPPTWEAACQLLRTHDPTREVWANFGKGFAKNPWNGYQAHPGPTVQDDHNAFTHYLTLVSVDFYGLTDSYEAPNYCGIWTYGKAIDNTRDYVDANPQNPGLPVWGFVECAGPNSLGEGLYPSMPPELIQPTIWNLVVHGATGVIYFCHNYLGPNHSATYPLEHPEVGGVMWAAHRAVRAYGAVLATPTIPGTTVTTDGAVGVTALTKRFGGDTFVFAMAEGDVPHPYGQAVTATITPPSVGALVEVLNESRTVALTGGSFTDHFAPYELHVYRVVGAQ